MAKDTSRLTFVTAGIAGLAAIVYRVVVFAGFSDDHYMHLAWAQQTLRGDLPGRDFVEPGMPLTIGLSAAAQRFLGTGLAAELLLCVLFIGATAALTCWIATRLTGSLWFGCVAVALQVAVYPRLYNYPKLFVPVVALLLLYRYLDRPSGGRAALVGAWMAIGFLFRHDYVLYVGAVSATALLCVWPRIGAPVALRHVGAWAGTACALVLPYLVVLTTLGGIVSHFRDTVEFGRAEQYEWNAPWPRFTVLPSPDLPDLSSLPPAGIVRQAARVVVLNSTSALAPVINDTNAGALLYYVAFLLPAALLVVAVRRMVRSGPANFSSEEGQLLVLAVLSLLLSLAFVRHPIEARLPDVAGTMPIVAVAAVASLRGHGTARTGLQWALVLVSAIAVVVHGRVWNRLYDAGILQAPSTTVTRIQTVVAGLHRWPWERFWPQGSVPPSVYYLKSCTAPDDRVLITYYAPEIFTFADRGFAAGQSFFTSTHFQSTSSQRTALERLKRERVPVALINLDQRSWFTERFGILDRYVDDNYRIVGTYRDDKNAEIAVAVRRDLRPAGTFSPTGWPCIRDGAASAPSTAQSID